VVFPGSATLSDSQNSISDFQPHSKNEGQVKRISMQTLAGTGALAAAGLVGLLLAAPLQSEPLTRGGMLSASCAGCHGTDGRSPGAIPGINEKSAEFIETALKDFRSGKRESTVMGRHARAYTDEDIRQIAEYMANRK
jgi:sulfide dehydrogenase cytochrome subunit